jgi:hypothetical protein
VQIQNARADGEEEAMIRFECDCGHRLKAFADQAGRRCKCSRCGRSLTIPAASTGPTPDGAYDHLPFAEPAPTDGAAKKPDRRRRNLWIAAAALAVGALLLGLYFILWGRTVENRLNDLTSDSSAARQRALVWLAQAAPEDSQRARVTAALEPLVVEGDPPKELDPDLLLRAYLHWANRDNVPTLVRMIDNPTLPAWRADKTGWVLEALSNLKDNRAANVLAAKLGDPALHDEAVHALNLLGPPAADAVTQQLFDGNADARARAGQLLTAYRTPTKKLLDEALSRLKSNDPDAQRSAAAWFADNAPENDAQRAKAAPLLAKLLDNLSSKMDVLALKALKLWATSDTLPQLTAYARREANAGRGDQALLDALSKFADDAAGEAIALQLTNPALRTQAGQALLKLGPTALKYVLPYVDSADVNGQLEARRLTPLLNVPADRFYDQFLADLGGADKTRTRSALQYLASLRPDATNRARIATALNGPLLDADAMIRQDALNAIQVWGGRENTTALLTLLESDPGAPDASKVQLISILGALQDPKAATTLAEGLTHASLRPIVSRALIVFGSGAEDAVAPFLKSTDPEARYAACRILAEIGTAKSLPALESAGNFWVDRVLYAQIQMAREKIQARK